MSTRELRSKSTSGFQSQWLAMLRDADERYRILASRLEQLGSPAAAMALSQLAQLKHDAAQAIPAEVRAGSIPASCRWQAREWRELLGKPHDWVPFRMLVAVLKHEWRAQQFVAHGVHGGETPQAGRSATKLRAMLGQHVALVENAIEHAERTKA
jgi:hypothetical protein